MNLPPIGYLYHHPRLDRKDDLFRLEIFISEVPTEKHFDVLRTRVLVKEENGEIENLSIVHPWTFGPTASLAPGMIIMEDRKGNKREGYSFGGTLSIVTLEDQTICTITSSAPILDLARTSPVKKLMVDEVEGLMAHYRATLMPETHFSERLFVLRPIEFYLGCLLELDKKLEQLHASSELYLDLAIHVHTELHRLAAAGLIPETVPSLEQTFLSNKH